MKENLSEILKICSKINMPKEVVNDMIDVAESYDFGKLQFYFDAVKQGDYEIYKRVNTEFADEIKLPTIWLLLLLSQAPDTYEKYKIMQIDEQIFCDTMGAFTRFLSEHKAQHGYYKFDREFWAYHQINMSIFRIGELEFELTKCVGDVVIDGEKIASVGDDIVAVHIPSDAKLSIDNCNSAYANARAFLCKYYPKYKNAYFTCNSWLLSPQLKQLLPQSSNILNFTRSFTIYATETDEQYKTWVFGRPDIEAKDFAEDTSLQRAIKKHVLNGGKIGRGRGVILK